MVKFTAKQGDGGTLVGLGLTRENINRLIAGQPIVVDLKELIGARANATILFGETQADIIHLLDEAKLLKGVMPPPTGGLAGVADIAAEAVAMADATIRDTRGNHPSRGAMLDYLKTYFHGIHATGAREYRQRLIAIAGVAIAAADFHDRAGG